ncbi:shikimate dehydrogenase [Dactylosporangium sp. CA-092794]|uniref:shikimate dehydrogenase n=1 Tax=Dactylosporangium sp. CA-092794 TaxID=3239929 RepID=UPI003D8DFB74
MTDTRPTILTGLIGAGIGASLSPPLHEREAELNGLRLAYRLMDLNTLGLAVSETPALLASARRQGFTGVNITHPCKQVVLDQLDDLSPEAELIGAVNTVTFTGGRSVGHNTDWHGFDTNLETGLPGAARGRVILLGAGGAGAAVAYAMLRTGTEKLVVIDLDRCRTDDLVRRMADIFGADRIVGAGLDRLKATLGCVDGLIHATPVGMAAHPGLPFPTRWLRPRVWVADLVYAPLRTRLLTEAAAVGCRTVSGGGMLVHQAAEAFRLFTGVTPEVGRMIEHFTALTSGVAVQARTPDPVAG